MKTIEDVNGIILAVGDKVKFETVNGNGRRETQYDIIEFVGESVIEGKKYDLTYVLNLEIIPNQK